MQPKIGIKPKDLSAVTATLNIILADENVLYIMTRNAHWNVEGNDFHAMHLFFESQYNELALMIDELAERIRTLGHYAVASLAKYLELTHLTEISKESNTSLGYIKELLAAHESIIYSMRENIDSDENLKDSGTEDFVTGLLEKHEKMAWMLRAHL
ncbi:MAG: DNA starvation/stationary phase protection protein [Ferruginibacter sp.]